jgi:heme-degrading monooxygenase HmoA
VFARILRMQLKKDKVEEAANLFKRSVVPLCRKQRGFKGAYYMTDAKTGEGVAMTLWENREAMLASEENRFFQEREAYEVALRAGTGTKK